MRYVQDIYVYRCIRACGVGTLSFFFSLEDARENTENVEKMFIAHDKTIYPEGGERRTLWAT